MLELDRKILFLSDYSFLFIRKLRLPTCVVWSPPHVFHWVPTLLRLAVLQPVMPTIIIFYMLFFDANVFREKYEYELFEGKNFNILPGLPDLQDQQWAKRKASLKSTWPVSKISPLIFEWFWIPSIKLRKDCQSPMLCPGLLLTSGNRNIQNFIPKLNQ